MATRYDRRLERLQDKHSESLVKVFACPTPNPKSPLGAADVHIAHCPATECVCAAEQQKHMTATRGRGSLIVLGYEEAKL